MSIKIDNAQLEESAWRHRNAERLRKIWNEASRKAGALQSRIGKQELAHDLRDADKDIWVYR